MLIYYPFSGILMGLLYIGIVYLFVRKERKVVFYSTIICVSILRVAFLVAWTAGVMIVRTNLNNDILTIDQFYILVERSYYVVAIPFLLIVMWFGGKIILAQKHFPVLRIVYLIVFIFGLGGVFLAGLPFHIALYYGFT